MVNHELVKSLTNMKNFSTTTKFQKVIFNAKVKNSEESTSIICVYIFYGKQNLEKNNYNDFKPIYICVCRISNWMVN